MSGDDLDRYVAENMRDPEFAAAFTEAQMRGVPATGDAATELLREALVAALREAGVWWAIDTDGPVDRVLPVVEAECRRRAADHATSPVRAAAAVLSDAELGDALDLWWAARRGEGEGGS